MGNKIKEISTKIYKPEILSCPICGNALKYQYTVSNKIVQFTSGKYFRIKNLGYGCPICKDGRIYFSQTANKLCFKGYTYSAKIVCTIAYYKRLHHGREGICDILATKGIEISDRNVDILYKKFNEFYEQDYDTLIHEAYENMLKEYNQIRISLDLITIEDTYYVIMYDYFTSKLLAIWDFSSFKDSKLDDILKKYISNYNISVIATVRNLKEGKFVPVIKKYIQGNTKFISFNKF